MRNGATMSIDIQELRELLDSPVRMLEVLEYAPEMLDEIEALRKYAKENDGLTVAYMAGSASRLDELRAKDVEIEALRKQRNELANNLWSAEDQWGDDYLWTKWKLSQHLTEALKKEISK